MKKLSKEQKNKIFYSLFLMEGIWIDRKIIVDNEFQKKLEELYAEGDVALTEDIVNIDLIRKHLKALISAPGIIEGASPDIKKRLGRALKGLEEKGY